MKPTIPLRLLAPFVVASLLGAQDAPPAPTGEAPEEAEVVKGVLRHESGADDGYTLIAPLGATETFLIDMQGEIVHAWGSELAPSGPAYLLDNGNLLRPGRLDDNPRFRGGGIGGRIEEYDWDGFLVWEYQLMDDGRTQHHDLAVLPNGNVLAIVWRHHDAEEVRAAGRDPRVVVDKGMWACAVVEIRPERPDGGEIVWEWDSWDHLIQDLDSELANYGSIPENPGRIDINADHRDRPPMTEAERKKLEELERQMAALGYAGGDEEEDEEDGQRLERGKNPDWLHMNSVNHHPELELLALSTPTLNEIWVIDHSTSREEARGSSGGRWGRGGDLLYRWGNPRNYGAGGDAERRLFYQHDPQWLPDEGDGLKLTLYNNGRGRPEGDYSTAIVLELPFDPERGFLREEGAAFGPEAPAWSWGSEGTLFSPFISGTQRLTNGNTLICEGANGRLVEVTAAGDVVWEYVNEHAGEPAPPTEIAPPTKGGALFRATRIPADAAALEGREFD